MQEGGEGQLASGAVEKTCHACDIGLVLTLKVWGIRASEDQRVNLPKYTNIARYALYDAGNSNYVTLIPSLIFPIYVGMLMGAETGKGAGDLAWGGMIALATLAAAILGPLIGNLADRRGSKFRLLMWTTWAAVLGTAMLTFPRPGMVWVAAMLFVATHVCYLLATVLYDAALADVTTKENAATVSSVAWGVGYAGGLVGLLLALLPQGDDVAKARVIFLIAAGMFLVLTLPLVLMRPRAERTRPLPKSEGERASLLELVRRFMREPRRARFLLAFFLFSNGVSAVIYFTALYATKTLKYDTDQLIWLFVLMNAVAAPASVVFGAVARRFGELKTLKGVVAAWVVVVLVIANVEAQTTFKVVASCAASLLGPVQALSRSLFRKIFPDESMSAFFGIQALATRSSALLGPLLFGLVSWLTSGNQRLGALSAAALFGVGLVVLFTVPKE